MTTTTFSVKRPLEVNIPQRRLPAQQHADICLQELINAGITNRACQAHLMAQLDHESAGFRALAEMFPHDVDPVIYFSRKYGHRRDLGNKVPEDGFLYRGRGFIQLTGKTNYRIASRFVGVPELFVLYPELASASPTNGVIVSMAWLSENWRRFGPAPWTVRGVTRIINGGFNGLADREQKYAKWYSRLRVRPEDERGPFPPPQGTNLKLDPGPKFILQNIFEVPDPARIIVVSHFYRLWQLALDAQELKIGKLTLYATTENGAHIKPAQAAEIVRQKPEAYERPSGFRPWFIRFKD